VRGGRRGCTYIGGLLDFRYMPIEVDLWLAQPRETFWYKMLLKEFESVDSLERMDKSDEARCIDGWLCKIILFIFE
jgi:hypothetical protein